MAEPPRYPEPGEDTGVRPPPRPTGMPRWVKVFIAVAILAALAFIGSRLLGVQHGPGLHSPPGASGGQTTRVEQEVEQP
jgi:hypothetical protein